ncbi:hypothetical protein N9850_07340 [Granulosicoccus sp.]|nr:hypothetical protein [Granulosicoccus sp.]MDB4223572.1 hypothetical protein [Granulosicoccus sp.]
MALFIFKYALPALLGYTLFVGIAGKFNPFNKPIYLEERPSWMLGLWTGISVFSVLSIGLHMAYGMTIEAARSLITPSAISMALLLGVGFSGYYWYRKLILAELDVIDDQHKNSAEAEIEWSEKINQLDPIIEKRESQIPVQADSNMLKLLQNELEKERALRQETERHLCVTRKALSKGHLIEPKVALDGAANSLFSNDMRSDDLELSVANLKRELVKAKHQMRLHIAARAKALSTANKSVAFARQSIDLRARLETELETAHAALAIRQTTIASLINRLERERRLTDDELAALAKHVAVNDPTLRSGNSEQIATGLESRQNARFTSGS